MTWFDSRCNGGVTSDENRRKEEEESTDGKKRLNGTYSVDEKRAMEYSCLFKGSVFGHIACLPYQLR